MTAPAGSSTHIRHRQPLLVLVSASTSTDLVVQTSRDRRHWKDHAPEALGRGLFKLVLPPADRTFWVRASAGEITTVPRQVVVAPPRPVSSTRPPEVTTAPATEAHNAMWEAYLEAIRRDAATDK